MDSTSFGFLVGGDCGDRGWWLIIFIILFRHYFAILVPAISSP